MTTSEQTNAALRCPTCGGNIVFDPEAQQFRCASCGSIQKVTPGKDTVEEYDFAEYREREGRRMLENGETALRCDVCGAEFFQPAEGTATVCPMCGSPQIKPEEEHNGIPVEGVVPFAIDRYEAQKRFGQWIRKRWFAPASLKRTFAEGELVGMYVPFWTYDADAVTQYCGRGGRTYTRRGRDGKTETYTQWYPVSGVVRGYYNDIQVCASKTASGNLIQKVLPYNTIGNTNPYHPQYLAGYQAECYTIDGIQGFKVAESYIDRDQRSRAESDIRGHGYSQAQVTGMNTHYDTVRYKQVLVPLWKARYGYAGKTYHYMINGENGKVSAQYPKSVGKIILVISANYFSDLNILIIFAADIQIIIDMTEYIKRNIDTQLIAWKEDSMRKPLLLRGARQVGKSSAVKHFGKQFKYFAEVNFERNKAIKTFFHGDLDVRSIAEKISSYINVPVEAGKTLLFLDEIQECPEAIMALRFFKEDYPELHVIAAGSLLEFTLQELPTFGVGRIHSLFMYPMTFDEFLYANNEEGLVKMRNEACGNRPLEQAFHDKLVEYFRIYLLVGGMPESVLAWTRTHDFNRCRNIQEDIVLTYEDDFSKYKKRVNSDLLRTTMRGVCHQAGEKLTFKQISADYQSSQIREALRLLTLAGIVTPVVSTSGNGIPLDAEADEKSMKVLFLDSGLLLAVLQLEGNLAQQLIELILAGTPQELVNKGGLTEMVAGLEILRNKPCIQRQKMFFWEQKGKSVAEIDYLEIHKMKITPIEIKSGTQGGMKSLWLFMREKKLTNAFRCSLENFGAFDYIDKEDHDAVRHVTILPLYALSLL